MAKKGKKKGSKSPVRERPTDEKPTTTTNTANTPASTVTAKPAPAAMERPNAEVVQIPTKEAVGSSIASVEGTTTTTATAPDVSVAATNETVVADTNNTSNTDNTDTTKDAYITFEHLSIIQKFGNNSNVDKETAPVEMHTALKSAEGNLSALTTTNYVTRFNPLKEAIWFSRKGIFATEYLQDWTMCKTFMTVKTSASALTTNLALLDLEGLPGDDNVLSLTELGNKLGDKLSNASFHITLEALYDLVEMDSNSNADSDRRNELFKRVASFVYKGSYDCLHKAKPQPGLLEAPTPPRFSFGMILQIYLKLKADGADTEITSDQWKNEMEIDPQDGAAVWLSLRKQAQLDLPRQAWWKVLFILVLEYEPHLLRMNLTLLDSSKVKSFADFRDESMEPPDQVKGKFYKKMIQQVFSLQNVCLLTDPPRTGEAMESVVNVLKKVFVSGEGTVFRKDIIEDTIMAPNPEPPVMSSEPESKARELAPMAEISVPDVESSAKAPSDAPGAPAEVSHAGAPEAKVAKDQPAPVPAPQVDAPGPNLAPGPKRDTGNANVGAVDADADAVAVATDANDVEEDVYNDDNDAYRETEKPTETNVDGKKDSKPPISTIRTHMTLGIPTSINPGQTSDMLSVTGSITGGGGDGSSGELVKEEALLDLMHQAASLCTSISKEKQHLVTRERRMGRNLKSAQDTLTGLEAINKQLMKENNDQKEEIYKREDDINQLHAEAKQAAKELSAMDIQNSQLQEQIEELKKTVIGLNNEKKTLQEDLATSNATSESLEDALEVSRKEMEALKAQLEMEQAAKKAVEDDLLSMTKAKSQVESELQDTQGLLESANEEIDRLEELQAEQQRAEAEARKAAMEARRREFEAAEREAEESLRKAEELRTAKAAARRSRPQTTRT